jgi:hypothetical protein
VSRHAAARRPRSAWLTLWTLKTWAHKVLRDTFAGIARDLESLLESAWRGPVFLATLLAVTLAVQALAGWGAQ